MRTALWRMAEIARESRVRSRGGERAPPAGARCARRDERRTNAATWRESRATPESRAPPALRTLRAPGATRATCNTGRPSCKARPAASVRGRARERRARSDERRATKANPREERHSNKAADSQRARAPRGPSTCRVRYTDARRGATSEVRRTRGRDVRCTPTPHEPPPAQLRW